MSELNYINETVVPRMPKSVSDEQLFVFVPVGSDIIAGIFKINTDDFDVASLPVLKIVESESLVSTILNPSGESIPNPKYNADGYVRAGVIKDYVHAADEALKTALNASIDKKQDITDDNLKTDSHDIVGAINELNSRLVGDENYEGLTSRVSELENTVGDSNSGLVKKVNDNTTVIGDANSGLVKQVNDNSEEIGKLRSDLNDTNTNLGTTNDNVTNLGNNKQDKAINIPGIEAKTVEGALTELDGESSAHAESINDLKAADESLTNRVTNLEQSAYGGETPIGSYDSGPTLPSEDELTNFVITHTTPSREPKLGDVVLFTQIVTGGTDKSYKFMYTATGWSNYVIPTVESATNNDKGILQGTLGDTTGNVQVSIVDGKVSDILVKDGATYKSIKTLLDGLVTKINTAQNTADNVIKKYNGVEFTLVSSTDTTMDKFPCKYTANIEGVTINNVADVYFSALQIPLEIFSSYVQVEDGKVSIFATVKTNYPTSVTVPTVRIS